MKEFSGIKANILLNNYRTQNTLFPSVNANIFKITMALKTHRSEVLNILLNNGTQKTLFRNVNANILLNNNGTQNTLFIKKKNLHKFEKKIGQ